jgi:hypothetical protein
MTNKQKKLIILVLSALHDAGKRGMPSGHLYAALMSETDLDEYNNVIGALEKVGFITNTHHLLCATDKGMEAGKQFNEAMAKETAPSGG